MMTGHTAPFVAPSVPLWRRYLTGIWATKGAFGPGEPAARSTTLVSMGAPILTDLPREECLRLLASVPVGRVGLSLQALPVVLPVNFALLDGEVVFRTVAGTKFHAAVGGTVLAFEVDGYESDGRSGWSVLVQGVSQVVTDPTELQRARQLTVDPWAVDGAADRIVRITVSVVSGRRFERSP
jgi:uncharacterized protein